MVALLATTALWAQSFTYEGLKYELYHGNVSVTRGNYSELTSVNIPSTITYQGKDYRVTSIGIAAFLNCTRLTSITIPNSVTSIESRAFDGCLGLTSITIPNSVTSIGTCAFSGCTSLTSIVVNGENTTYDSRNDCNAIIKTKSNTLIVGCQATIIPNSVTSIDWYAFSGCTSLTSITIPNSITKIGSSAFLNCTSLKKVYYTGDIKGWLSIDMTDYSSNPYSNNPIYYSHNLYINNVLLTDLIIPEGITSISSNFAHCTSLTSITIPSSVMSFGLHAFSGCTGLTSITIPSSVMSINRYAFSGCTGLTSITIPNSVTSIGGYAFKGCTGLTSITMGNGITSIGDTCFGGCTNLTTITIGSTIEQIGEHVFADCTNIDTLIITNDVKKIGSLFKECSNLKYISLGSNVKSIADKAFYSAQRLRRITCYAKEAPEIQEKTFYNYKTYVRVPCEMIDDYKIDVVWSLFENLQCIDAENVSTDGTITITPSDNTVDITWPTNGNADTYSILITKDGEEVCTLVFNSSGQLMRIAFAAPARNGAERHAPAAVLTQNGYRFTVTGLNSGTQYAYAIDVKDKTGTSLNTYKGTFTTTVDGKSTDVEDVTTDTSLESDAPRKVFRDGQVYILRGEKMFTLTGVEVNL